MAIQSPWSPGPTKESGLQIAKELAARGLTVLVGSRNLEPGERAAKSVGANARAIQLDVTNQASINAAAERIRNEFGRLDVLVNNAAISHRGKPDRSLEEMVKSQRASIASLDEVRAVFERRCSASSPSRRRCCRSSVNRRPGASSTSRAAPAR